MAGVFDFSVMVDPRHSRMDRLRASVSSLWQLNAFFPVVIDDLLDVAMAIYAADRLARRPRSNGAWRARNLELLIPVAEPERWTTLGDQLSDLLQWLTTDKWQLSFTTLETQRVRPASAFPAVRSQHPFVALYSGGLDSLAGTVAQALEPAFDGGVLVGAQAAPRLIRLQSEQHHALQERLPAIHWEPLHGFGHGLKLHGLGEWDIAEQRQEKSQRSRAFLFMVFGAVTAFAYGTNRLYVYENGMGAINLPYTPSFRGADMTRAMHPRTLLLISRFLTALLDKPFSVENHSMWRTKGQMCDQLREVGLGDLALLTKSCDSFPLREATDQCGLCTSCVLRRISLHAGGLSQLEHDQPHYKTDIYALYPDSNNDALRPYGFMLQQAQTMRELLERDHEDAFLDFRFHFDPIEEARHAIQDMNNWSMQAVDQRLSDLYSRHVTEVLAFHSRLTSQPIRSAKMAGSIS